MDIAAFRARHPDIRLAPSVSGDFMAWGGPIPPEEPLRDKDMGRLISRVEFILGDVNPENM